MDAGEARGDATLDALDARAPEVEWILVNLGTPSAPTEEAVRAFLGEFLADPMVVELPPWLWRPFLAGVVLRRRPRRTAEAYRAVWTDAGSPLLVGTRRLARALAERAPPGVRVASAYRYGGEERVDRVLERALARGAAVVVTPLFPQPTASSSGTIEAFVQRTARRLGAAGRVHLAPLAPEAPGYVAAAAERVREAEARLAGGRADHLVFSFHGIPAKVDRREGARYSSACRATAAAVLAALGRGPAGSTLAFQSRFGPAEWLSPATADVLVERARAGDRRVVVSTPGFMTGGLETLEELGLRGRRAFLDAGGEELLLADPPAGHPRCQAALAEAFESIRRAMTLP